ncbi:hypothetical protein V6N12_045587 [Hibiscus sabdariffa]|uniref:Uncharacterized protein n=1 Tax=Hibiscus sabdariffa TaxID=183260 RepID=A0ABR2G366_9ROSI
MPSRNRVEHRQKKSGNHQQTKPPPGSKTLEYLCEAEPNAHFPQPDDRPKKGHFGNPLPNLRPLLSSSCPHPPQRQVQPISVGLGQKDYMKKMDLEVAIPIKNSSEEFGYRYAPEYRYSATFGLAVPIRLSNGTDTSSKLYRYSPSSTDTRIPARNLGSPATTPEAQATFAATPASPPAPDHQSPPAHSTDAPPTYILQLCNQLQRMEARQIEFIEESKVFQTTLLQFLHDNFPAAAESIPAPPVATPTTVNLAADPSVGVGKWRRSIVPKNATSDALDWNTPYEHPPSPPAPTSAPPPPPPPTDILESSNMWKRKAPTARILTEDYSPEPTEDPTTEADT